MNSINRATCLLRNTALAGTIAAILALQSASADITIASGATTNIDDSATTLVGTTKTFNETGICTLNANSRLRANASQAGPTLSIVNNASIVFAGITPRLAFNDNDMDFVVNGPITNTSSGATTLAISTGSSGNGDRESVTFNSGIPDVGDGSPLGVTISFRCQSGSQSWVNLNAVNTFTGPLTLAQGGGPAAGCLTIGGTITHSSGNTSNGLGTLGNGIYPGAIALGSTTTLNYASSAAQTLSGAISGIGFLQVTGSGTLTLSGPSTYSSNTTVNAGSTLVLDSAGSLTFVITDASSNKITGGGTATLDGTFTIDTSLVSSSNGSWTLVDVATKSFGGSFGVAGFTKSGEVFTKADASGKTWTFDTTSGVLSVAAPALITSFGVTGGTAAIDQVSKTVTLLVAPGTDLTSLAPSYTLSSGTCDHDSGTTSYNFSSPQTYKVTDGATENNYIVTVSVSQLPLGGLVVWLKADAVNAADTTQVDGSGNVLKWIDQSGNFHNATSQTGSQPAPTYVANSLNGKPVLHFTQTGDDSGGRLYLGDLSAKFPSAASLYTVGTINNDARYSLFGNRNNDERWVADSWTESTPGSFRGGRAGGSFSFGKWPQSGSHLFTLESSSSVYRMLLDGTQIGADSPDYNTGSGLNWNIGDGAAGNGAQLNGDIAEVILYDHVLSADEANTVGLYLTQKYALTTEYQVPSPNIVSFGPGASIGKVSGNAASITWYVANGTNVTTLTPTFSLANATTCTVGGVTAVSGETRNFTDPVTYNVSDGITNNAYTVTVIVAPPAPAGLGTSDGLVAWYDASQLHGLSNGNSVDTWTDSSGYGHTASRTAGTMTYADSQVNGLPVVQFRNQGYADIVGTLFAKDQYMVIRNPDSSNGFTQWGAALGNVTDQHGYMMGNEAGSFWGGNSPAAVSENGTVLPGNNVTNDGVYIILKITGAYPDTNPRNYSLGNCYGNGSAKYHSCSLDVAEIIAYDHVLTPGQELAVGAYLTAKYNIEGSTYPTGPQAKITSFSFPTCGDASITGTTITKYVPQGTAVTALAPTFTLSTDATCVPVSGSTQDFSSPVHYIVTASDSTTKDYTVTVTILPPGPPVGDYARWFDASALGLADNAPVTQWNDISGNGANATVPSGNATPVYVANSGTASGLGAIYFAGNNGAGNSAALRFTRDSNIRTVFSVFKGNSFLLTDADAYHFHRPSDDNAASSLWAGYSDAINNGSTYVNGVLVDGRNDPMPTTLHNGYNLVEVLTDGGTAQADSFNKDRTYHAGNQYQAEVIIYDRVLSEQERLQVETYLTSKWFSAATSGYASWATQNAGGGAANEDYNQDGVANGVAYFMGMNGLATNPGVIDGKVTWPHVGTVASFEVQVSDNLSTWQTATSGVDLSDPGKVVFTLPTGAERKFCRLVVTP